MNRLHAAVLGALCLVPAVAVADQPGWAFEGGLPIIFEVHNPVAAALYTVEGTVLTDEQIRAAMDIDRGDPLVLIRDGAVVGAGTIGDIVAQRRSDADHERALFLRPAGLPEGVEAPAFPRGPAALADDGYDLYVLTDQVVEVLAPDPLFTDISWGVHDYCVRVGRLRFAIIRERAPGAEGFRGWHVEKLEDTGPLKVHADYTWRP
ncbi:MAG TPA: hypothetical protein PLL30_14945 [Candidatus Krumholzibacteria bacterium]|nr:hypothetical protein [Candidatus Krumholzibacteria bacterium]HPD73066.1 hypothetical protein [Candidatus Krumholzibacteria bacterium]HRY41866.1 hypothetical protein [Candidatus Krumholzibacteria bacterium]